MTPLRQRIVLASAGVAALAGWLAAPRVVAMRATAPAQGTGSSATGASTSVKSVEVEHTRRTMMARKLEIPAATIEAYAQVELAARVAGYVAEVRVELGDRVKAGDLLAVIRVPELDQDLAEARAQAAAKAAELEADRTPGLAAADARIREAQAMRDVASRNADMRQSALRFAETDFARREALHKDGALPDDAFDAAQKNRDEARLATSVANAEVAVAEAKVRDAEAARAVAAAKVDVAGAEVALARAHVEKIETLVSFARITAPFDGVVTKRLIDAGSLVQGGSSGKGSPLFVLHQIDRMRLAVEFPESGLAWIAAGTVAQVQPFAFDRKTLEAKVARLASALNLSTRTMRIELDLDNGDGKLCHGMAARVFFELDPHPDALTISASALLIEGGAKFVLVVANDIVEKRPVETGLDDGIRIEITKGLSDADAVVVTGKGNVTEGAHVRAVVKERSE